MFVFRVKTGTRHHQHFITAHETSLKVESNSSAQAALTVMVLPCSCIPIICSTAARSSTSHSSCSRRCVSITVSIFPTSAQLSAREFFFLVLRPCAPYQRTPNTNRLISFYHFYAQLRAKPLVQILTRILATLRLCMWAHNDVCCWGLFRVGSHTILPHGAKWFSIIQNSPKLPNFILHQSS